MSTKVTMSAIQGEKNDRKKNKTKKTMKSDAGVVNEIKEYFFNQMFIKYKAQKSH